MVFVYVARWDGLGAIPEGTVLGSLVGDLADYEWARPIVEGRCPIHDVAMRVVPLSPHAAEQAFGGDGMVRGGDFERRYGLCPVEVEEAVGGLWHWRCWAVET